MGVSTDAILFYGYCWDEETDRPWTIGREDDEANEEKDDEANRDDENPDEDWEARYAHAHGIFRPSTPYPERTVPRTRENGYDSRPKDYTPAERAILDAHSAFWKQKHDLVKASRCKISTHCSSDYRMPYVCIKASTRISSRGSMTQIESLAVDPAWDGELAAFCAKMGIRTEGLRPAWWLVSNWS